MAIRPRPPVVCLHGNQDLPEALPPTPVLPRRGPFLHQHGAGRRPERAPYTGRKRIQTGVADRTDSGEPSASSGRAARTSVMMAAAAGAPLQPLRAGADAMAARRRRPASMPDSRRALEPVCISLPVSLRRYASPPAARPLRFVSFAAAGSRILTQNVGQISFHQKL